MGLLLGYLQGLGPLVVPFVRHGQGEEEEFYNHYVDMKMNRFWNVHHKFHVTAIDYIHN